MTAPNVARPAVETPMPTDMDSAMSLVLADTKAQTAAESGESGTPLRNELGQFVSASGDTTAIPPAQLPDAPDLIPAEGTVAASDLAADGAEPVVEIPDGYVAPPALPEDKAVGFKVRDAEGEIVPPDLTWELTANGKPRTLSTDKLVAFAQMGVYNHEREQAAQQIQVRSQQIERAYQESQQGIELRDQQIERLLSDPEFLVRAQTAWAQQNTPEARWERQQQEMATKQQQLELQQATFETKQFIDGTMAPALEMLVAAYPTVSRDELAAKFFLAADPYRQHGVLMPQGHDALKRWVLTSLEPEVRQLHDARNAERVVPAKAVAKEVAKVTAKATADVAAAQAKAQKARSVATRALKPAGRAMPDTPQEKPVTSLKDAESVILGKTMAAMRAG